MKCSKFVICCVFMYVCVWVSARESECVWIFYHLNSRWFMGIGYLIKPHSSIRDQNQTIKNSRICRPMSETESDRRARKMRLNEGRMWICDDIFFCSLLVINCQCLRFCFRAFESFRCCSEHFNRSSRANRFTPDADTTWRRMKNVHSSLRRIYIRHTIQQHSNTPSAEKMRFV